MSRSSLRGALAAALLACLLLRAGAGAAEREGFTAVTGPCDLAFPRDHGPHPDHRTEWWYYTGHLQDRQGRPFGFQLTFFRSGLKPPGDAGEEPQRPSAWRSAQLFIGHLALTDPPGGRHHQAQRSARAALGMAGAAVAQETVTLFIGPWLARIGPQGQRLEAAAPEFGLRLDLVAAQEPVLHGDKGMSRKGGAAGEASCYYSLPRLAARGTLTIDGRPLRVTGLAWMDHEFSTAPLAPGILGWDWFGLQLDDGSALMLYRLRRAGEAVDPASSGTFVAPNGQSAHLASEDVQVTVLDTWRSPASGARYPARWRIAVPSRDLVLTLAPMLPDQEMRTGATTGVTYWEGSVSLQGTAGGRPLTGRGYAELTGYASPFAAPL
jgi:predicted secreted hydrolase